MFALALLARLGFLFLADQPLLYTHQYTYFTNGLRIAEHPSPWRYVLTSDEWRTWDGHWTIAPLYHLFLAAVFRLGGPHLLLVRLLQCALDAAAAVAVASLGRRAAGPRGVWAGVAYALYWPALEMPTWTLTENLHTPLFTAALAVLAGEAARPSRGRAFLGGALLGLSALARSVSSGFVGVAALWRLWAGGGRRAWPAAALVAAGGAAMILPWTARNVFLAGDAVLIESAAFENIWWANHFTDRARYLRQEEVVHGQPTPAAKRAAALHFALRGIRRSPGDFVQKVRTNFWHFVRPEGLQNLFGVQRSLEPWRHAGTLLLDDLPLLLAIPPFVSFLAAGRPSPARGLIALWTAYYLFMVVVLFHNEIRYRSAFVPFLFAGAVAGLSPPDPAGRRRLVHWAALGLGAAISIGAAWPYGVHVWGALRSIPAMRRAQAAVQRGDLERAAAETADAAARDPRSARPWLDLGKALAWAGRPFEAAQAYEREAGRVNFANWRPALGLQAARGVTGPPEEEARLRQRLDRASWDMDPWLLLESAWREVPPPRADEVLLARGDYGAVRGFLYPRGLDPSLNAHRREWNRYDLMGGPQPPPGPHRWTRGHAWIRLVPTQPASAYEVTIEMGAPFPSTLRSPDVEVRVGAGGPQRVVLDDTIRPYRFQGSAERGALLLAIRAPTWSRAGEPADQGIRVDRVSVRPLS